MIIEHFIYLSLQMSHWIVPLSSVCTTLMCRDKLLLCIYCLAQYLQCSTFLGAVLTVSVIETSDTDWGEVSRGVTAEPTEGVELRVKQGVALSSTSQDDCVPVRWSVCSVGVIVFCCFVDRIQNL
jgi:hypothetical protein